MIVIDEDNPDVKVAPSQRMLSSASAGGTYESSHLVQDPPPAYSGSSYGAIYNTPLHFPEDVPTPQGRRQRFVRGENAKKRFLKAFAIAIGIWVLIAVITMGDVDLIARNESKRRKNRQGMVPNPGRGRKPVERIRDPTCIVDLGRSRRTDGSSSDRRYSTELKFSLPVASNLAFFANDTYSYGTFMIDVVENAASEVDVDVVISHQTQETLQRSKVCLFKEHTESSIGIMATGDDSSLFSNTDFLRYDIYVKLPVPTSNKPEPLYIPRLSADFALFSMEIADLSTRVEFGEIDLKTFGNSIEAKSITARKARLQTSQSSIQGHFTTSSSLELITENAPIQADVSMLNSNSSSHAPTRLALHTKNAAINARLDLSNPSTVLRPFSSRSRRPSLDGPHASKTLPESIGGKFEINSTTTDAPLSLSILTQPYSSHLTLSAYTSRAAAEVELPSVQQQFSGGFRLETSGLEPVLGFSSQDQKESGGGGGGKHRHRDVNISKARDGVKHLVEGNVTWFGDDDDRGRVEEGGSGFVELSTSELPAVLWL